MTITSTLTSLYAWEKGLSRQLQNIILLNENSFLESVVLCGRRHIGCFPDLTDPVIAQRYRLAGDQPFGKDVLPALDKRFKDRKPENMPFIFMQGEKTYPSATSIVGIASEAELSDVVLKAGNPGEHEKKKRESRERYERSASRIAMGERIRNFLAGNHFKHFMVPEQRLFKIPKYDETEGAKDKEGNRLPLINDKGFIVVEERMEIYNRVKTSRKLRHCPEEIQVEIGHELGRLVYLGIIDPHFGNFSLIKDETEKWIFAIVDTESNGLWDAFKTGSEVIFRKRELKNVKRAQRFSADYLSDYPAKMKEIVTTYLDKAAAEKSDLKERVEHYKSHSLRFLACPIALAAYCALKIFFIPLQLYFGLKSFSKAS